jgi:adenylate cyclase
MLSPQISRNISRIIPFGLIWLIFGIIYSLLEKGLLGDLRYYPSTGNPYDFTGNLFFHLLYETVLGLFVGTIEILFLNKLFSKKSLGKKIAYKTAFYVAIMITFLLVITIVSNSLILKTSLFDSQVWENVLKFSSTFSFWSVELYIAVIIGLSLFYTEVSDSIGQEVLNSFFTGKYHTPIVEERIFMFLDMKSSTTIAEKIGHVKYFELLKEYYKDLSNPIVHYRGEIYQYVGDEIVVSWKLKSGLQNRNCLKCFLSMKEVINKQSEKYILKFGLVPSFKAGFHLGKVTTGEIGVVKKNILFTGDVLNTTSRIQGLCNSYNVDILISGDLIRKMNFDSEFTTVSLGENELRGRDEKVELFTIL